METRIDRDRLRDLRQKRPMTQEGLADLSGLHPRTIQRIERSGIASVQSIRCIARALEVDVSALELQPGKDIEKDNAFRSVANVLRGAGAAFLWVALSALVWTGNSEGGALAAVVAALGFASFCVGLWLLGEGNRREALLR